MEAKWLSIMVVGAAFAMFGSLAITSKSEAECKISYAQSTKTADEIMKLCKAQL